MTRAGVPYSPDEMPGDDPDSVDDTDLVQLEESDILDGDAPERAPEDPLDEGWVPNETPRGVAAWGVTPFEEEEGEPLDRRVRAEVPDTDDEEDGDGLGDAADTDGELRDDQVGGERAGRLVAGDGEDWWATDVGIDGAAASAEEAAVHLVDDPDL